MASECDLCGLCCCRLIVEIGQADAAREPRIRDAADEILGFDGPEYRMARPCRFLGPKNRCSIYRTRPDVCRAFEAGSGQCRELREAAGLPPLPPAI